MKAKNLCYLIVLILCFGCNANNKTTTMEKKHKILVIAPLSGPGAELGQSSKIGMQLSLEDISITKHSTNIELIYQDSKTDPKTALSIFSSRNLYSDESIIISEMSGVTRALVDHAKEAKVLLLATLVGVPNLNENSPYFLRINVTSKAIAPSLARFAAKRYEQIACLYLNDDYGLANFELFKNTYQENSGKVIFSEAFANNPAEVRLLVEKVIRSNTKAVFIAGYGQTYISLFKAFKELAPQIQLFADIGIVNTPIFNAIGNATDGVYVAATEIDEYPQKTESAKRFADKYTKLSNNTRPDYVTAFSYDTIQVLHKALEAVPDGDPIKIRQYLISQKVSGLGGNFVFNQTTGDSEYEELPIFQIRGGEIIRETNP